jgi:hypothetical protein
MTPASLKFIWKHDPPGKVGRWRCGTRQGKLGSVWEASGQWWASANGIELFQGGFASSEQAIKWVESNAVGIPTQGDKT